MLKITYHHNLIQGTDEWHDARRGLITASTMHLLLTPSGKIAKNDKVRMLAYELAAQRETNITEDHFQSFDMERGHIEEDLARTVYSKNYEEVTECGFVTRAFENFIIGCSPDGLVNSTGGIEVKSRKQKYQVKTVVEDIVPPEYMLQIQTFLLVTERKWIDFLQYSNGMPMFVNRVEPDLDMQKKILEVVGEFEKTVQLIQEAYRIKSARFIKCERVDHMHGDTITSSGGNDG